MAPTAAQMSRFDLLKFQRDQKAWSYRNFGRGKAYRSLLGLVEEVGELAHAHLKGEQRIRGSKNENFLKAVDAVGDVIIYLTDYCNRRGLSIEACLDMAWSEVRLRNWKKYPLTGRPNVRKK